MNPGVKQVFAPSTTAAWVAAAPRYSPWSRILYFIIHSAGFSLERVMPGGSIVFTERYLDIAFTPPALRGAWTRRVKIFVERYLPVLEERGVEVVEPRPVEPGLLEAVHDREYIEYVKRASERGQGWLDYGDTPAYPGVFEDALLAVSGSVTCASGIRGGEACFNPQGGFHHARRRSAGGFCVFNDVALSALLLSRRGRVAVVDVDAHHGDGTQEILYETPILKISLHGYGYGFYPGTGWIDELGRGEGRCLNVNIPVPLGSGDDVFEAALGFIGRVLESYRPDYIVLQGGVDGHVGDPLVGLRYTDNSYWQLGLMLHGYLRGGAGIVVLGGGGYVPEEAARLWALEYSAILWGEDTPLRPTERPTRSEEWIRGVVDDRIRFLSEKLSECGLLT